MMSRPERVMQFAAVLSLLLMALLLRLPAFDDRPLWADELWRVLMIFNPHYLVNYFLSPNDQAAITSPIYAYLVKATSAFHVSPSTLRLSALLPGIAAPLLAFALVRKVGGSIAVSFLAGLLFAFNEIFTSYSNAMKPYVFETCVHLLCLYGWLTVAQAPRLQRGTWLLCFSMLFLAVFASANTVFLLPAIGISLAVKYLIGRDFRSFWMLTGGYALLGALVAALYFFCWRYGNDSDMLRYWAPGFAAPDQSYPAFWFTQAYGMWLAAFTTFISSPRIFGYLAALALLAGLWSRRESFKSVVSPERDWAIFYLVFFSTLMLANLLHIWPLGDLRPNLFIYTHMIVLAFVVAARTRWSHWVAVGACLAIAALMTWRLISPNGHYYTELSKRLQVLGSGLEQNLTVIQDFSADGPIGKQIAANCASGKTTVFIDGFMSMAIQYYRDYDDEHHKDTDLLSGKCVNIVYHDTAYAAVPKSVDFLAGKLPSHSTVWFLYAHGGPDDAASMMKAASHFGRIVAFRPYQAAGYFAVQTDSVRSAPAP